MFISEQLTSVVQYQSLILKLSDKEYIFKYIFEYVFFTPLTLLPFPITLKHMTREQALQLMEEYTANQALRRHMLAVETVMRHLAKKYDQDQEDWGLAGLLHDFDYEKFETIPDHPVKGSKILEELGVSQEIRQAILGHANLPEYPRTTLIDKALFAIDELTGLVMACVYVRPSKSVHDLELKSVKKKLKDKSFAVGVSRQDIVQGAEELEEDVDQIINEVITALRGNADTLGLSGPA